MKNFSEMMWLYRSNFTPVYIREETMGKIDVFVGSLIEKKKKEIHHQIDCHSERKRFTTGLMGEAALEQLLGIDIINWTIGDSAYYHHPDVPGYNVGIKTVEYGKFPIIFKSNNYPQIICVRSLKENNKIMVCGLATTDVLCECQDDELVLDPGLRAKGTKTGFWGFGKLLPINSIDDIIMFKKMKL